MKARLTTSQKRQIAALAVEKSQVIDNGRMVVYQKDDEFTILIGSEYRDENHKLVAVLEVWNESKPYTQAMFLRQLENQQEE